MRRCTLCKKKQNGNGSFFGIPKDERRRNTWNQICNINFKPCSLVCMDHFAPSDIVKGLKSAYLLPSAVPRVPAGFRPKRPYTSTCNQPSDVRAQVIFTESESNKLTNFPHLKSVNNNVMSPIPVIAGPQLSTTGEMCVVKTVNFPVVHPKKACREQETQTDPITILDNDESKRVLYSKIRALNSKINELELKLLQSTADKHALPRRRG